MLSLLYQEHLKFNKDVAMMRVGNGQSNLLINSDYDQVLVIDLSGRKTQSILFPEPVDEFLIHTWLVSPDGSSSFLLSSDPLDFGLTLDHRQLTAKKFGIPSNFPPITELCWIAPELNMLDYNGNIWTLKNDTIVPAKSEIYHQEPAKTYKTLIQQFTVLKSESCGEILYIMDREHAAIGYLSMPLGKTTLISLNDDDPVDVVQYREHLFVCFEQAIFQHYQGASQLMLHPMEGQYFRALDVIQNENGACLAVLAATLDETARPREFIDIYTLS